MRLRRKQTHKICRLGSDFLKYLMKTKKGNGKDARVFLKENLTQEEYSAARESTLQLFTHLKL